MGARTVEEEIEGQMVDLMERAHQRGQEQGVAFALFIERELGYDFDTHDGGFDRDAFRRAVAKFTEGFLSQLDEENGVDSELLVMAAQEGLDKVDEGDASLEYRSVPYEYVLESDPEWVHEANPSVGIDRKLESLAARAEVEGVSLCAQIHGVTCVVSADGLWHVGFESPDDYCADEQEWKGEDPGVMGASYAHWFMDHFLQVVAACSDEMSQRTGIEGQVPAVFIAQAFKEERAAVGEDEEQEETQVEPIDSRAGYVEESEHIGNPSTAKPVGARFFEVMHMNVHLCGILELFDADGEVTEQLNLFGFPDLKDSDGMGSRLDERVARLAERVAKDRGVAITVRQGVQLEMCGAHRMMSTPEVAKGAEEAKPPRDGRLH